MSKSVVRSMKNLTKGYSSTEVKVRDATSNDAWGPSGTQMSEIAQMTYNQSEFTEIMDMLDKRLNDKGKNWRHVLKSLKVLDYCLHEGSELCCTWARKNIYIIKTLREFMYTDEDGRDVGANVRQSAKELTSLIMDEDRLRLERSDRKSWKTRVTGLDEEGSSASGSYAPPEGTPTRSRQNKQRRTNPTDDDDLEFKLALEASKNQAEEDAKRRTSTVPSTSGDDDDLAKAIKLSQEEDEARRRKLEEQNAVSLFDDSPTPIAQQPQATGWNQGYQQQSAVDWFGNPIDQQQPQSTGYLNNSYMQQAQQTGYQDAYGYGQQQQQYMQPQQTGYQAQYMQPQQTAYMQPQQTGFNNPYAQQQMTGFGDQNQQAQQPGHNNPFAANGGGQDGIKPQPTGSNNPFASAAARQPSQPSTPNRAPTLSTLQEQRTAMQYSAPPPQKEMDPHQARLNALLASGEGMDTFGNTGNSRIPAQHTAPGTFVNSSGANTNRLVAEKTGTNPFLHNQFTGAPQQQPQQTGFQPQYGQQQQFQQQPQGYGQQGMMPMQTGPAGLGGYGGGGGYQAQSANPFGQQRQQQQQPQGPSGGSLIDL